MKHFFKVLLVLVCFFALGTMAFGQTTYTSTATGNWSTMTWSPAGTPGALDNVVIADGHTVTINTAVSIANLTVGQGATGILQYENTTTIRTLTVSGDVTINSGAAFNLGTQTNNVEHLFNLGGNLVIANSGTLNIGSGSAKGVVTTFNKLTAGDQTVSSPGVPTSVVLGKIKVSRTASTDRVLCSVTGSMRGGNLSLQMTMGTWEQSAGTLSGPAATATNLQLDQPNGKLVISGSGSVSLTSSVIGIGGANGFEGEIVVNTSGTFTIGSLSNQARLQNSGGLLTIQSGTVNIGGRLTISGPANISGGNINIDPQGAFTALAGTSNAFEVGSTGSLTMSGGTITVIDPISTTGTGLEVKLSTSATYNITGGTIRLGDGVSTTTGPDGFQMSTHTVPLWDVVLNGNNSATGRAVTLTDAATARNLVVKNNLTMNSGTLFANFGGTSSNITIGGAYSNSGTLSLGTTSTITLNGSSAQSTGASFPSSIYNLVLSNSAGVTISNPVTVTNTLTLGGNNSYTNLSSVTGYTGVTYAATVAQTTGPELPASITNLTVNNLSGVTLSGNKTVSGTLTLTNGTLAIGANKITISNDQPGAVVIPSSTGSITGQIERAIQTNNTGIYQFTNMNTYIVPSASQPTTSMSITSYPSTYPPFAPAGTAINRYYVILPTPSNFSASEVRLEYLDAENISLISELNLVLFHRDAAVPAWINLGGAPDGTNNFVTTGPGANINTWSDWAVGDGANPLPIQLTSFTGTLLNNGVRLNWSTASEVNNYGFYVQKRTTGTTEWNELASSFIAGHGTTNTPQHYNFTDNSRMSGSLQYRLKQVDLDGTLHFTEPITVSSPTSVAEVAPLEFALKQNYPNPFNPATEIRFSLEKTARATLIVYNALGQKVQTLFDGVAEAGQYHTVRFDGASLASGIYFYRLQTENSSELKKFVLLK